MRFSRRRRQVQPGVVGRWSGWCQAQAPPRWRSTPTFRWRGHSHRRRGRPLVGADFAQPEPNGRFRTVPPGKKTVSTPAQKALHQNLGGFHSGVRTSL